MDVKVERKAATLDHCDPRAFGWTGCSEEVAAVHVFQRRKKKKKTERDEGTETGQIAFIPPPLDANDALHTSK